VTTHSCAPRQRWRSIGSASRLQSEIYWHSFELKASLGRPPTRSGWRLKAIERMRSRRLGSRRLSRESYATATPPRVWPLSQLNEALHELAAAQQLLLRFQFYEWEELGAWTKSESPWGRGPAELDFALPWSELVRSAIEQALEGVEVREALGQRRGGADLDRSSRTNGAVDGCDERLLSARPHARRTAGIHDEELRT